MATISFTIPDAIKIISLSRRYTEPGQVQQWLLTFEKEYTLPKSGVRVRTSFHKLAPWDELFFGLEELIDAQHEREFAIGRITRTAYFQQKAKEKEELKKDLDDLFNSL